MTWEHLAGRIASFVALLFALGCNRTDASELREWSPSDHDNQPNPGAGQVDTEKRKAMMPDLTRQGIDDVVLVTWKQNCVACHGVIGRGDGPQGRSLRPPDFTNPEWQRVALDSEMARTIKNGRGPMPAFAQLPDNTVQGLINLIRLLNPNRKPTPQEGDAAQDDAAQDDAAQDDAAQDDAAQDDAAQDDAAQDDAAQAPSPTPPSP